VVRAGVSFVVIATASDHVFFGAVIPFHRDDRRTPV
jgi:hypothetical protein